MGIVTLLSDFGAASPYAATMKAVVASLCDATLIDITHEVPPHDIRTGAYLLAALAPHTPAGTVHLAVVDPGVGSPRKPLVVVSGGQFFVGPDNGLLLPAAKRVGYARVFEVRAGAILGPAASATFHGRDVFAPVAGHLARGTPVATLGDHVTSYADFDFGVGRREGSEMIGEVLWVDRFGNLVTNIPGEYLTGSDRAATIQMGGMSIAARVCRTYSDVERGAVVILVGSDGLVEIAVREGNAATLLQAAAGTPVRVTHDTLRG